MNELDQSAINEIARASMHRILANRANSELSTGPKTEEGKAASSRNSFKHGFTSASIWVYEGEEDNFERLRKGLLEEIKPQGELERFQFDIVLHSSWIVERIMSEESALLSKGALCNLELGKHLDRLNRYRRNHERSMRQALAELRRLQAERVWRRESRIFKTESVIVQTRPQGVPIPRPIPRYSSPPKLATNAA